MTHDLAHAMHQFRRWFRRNGLPLDGIEVIVRFPSDQAWCGAVGTLALDLQRLSHVGGAPIPSKVAEGTLYGVKFRFAQDTGDGSFTSEHDKRLAAQAMREHAPLIQSQEREKAAKIAESWGGEKGEAIAAAIRASSPTQK
jgi:hypothetical protein